MEKLVFIERLWNAIKEKKSRVLVGLDPDLKKMPNKFVAKCIDKFGDNIEGYAKTVEIFNEMVIEAVNDIAVAFKPQIAYYEMLGVPGMVAYSRTMKKIQSVGNISIGDIKRGDIGSTALAYCNAHLSGSFSNDFHADAVTVNPYFGIDSISPFLKAIETDQKGIFILLRTSNKSASELQDFGERENPSKKGKKLYEHLASLISVWGSESSKNGYSNVGVVVGATYPEELVQLREILPKTPFLIPGFGAQGATAKDVKGGFDKNGLGAIVNSSRGIIYAGKESEDFQSYVRKAAQEMRDDIEKEIKTE